MGDMLEDWQQRLLEWAILAWEAIQTPPVLFQLTVIVILFFPALLLSRRIEPGLKKRADGIRIFPGLKRLVMAFLDRFEWLLYAAFLVGASAATQVIGWPPNNFLIEGVALLAAAWLTISVISHLIRNRLVGRAFSILAWLYVATLVFGVNDNVVALLQSPEVTINGRPFTLLDALQKLALIGFIVWAAISAGNFLDRQIQGLTELTPSLRVLVGKMVRIALIVFTIMLGLNIVGLDLTALTVLSGAVGVGIGFGLQKVVSNFISGIIILLDRSIKPGDTISLGDTFGWIRELRARFVSVITRDGREFLIPNEDFITREVINWSFSDEYVRLDVPFGVSYDSNPHEVSALAIEAAQTVERVDSTRKKPVCWMTGFGDSSLDFKLRFWIRDPQQGLTNIRGKVLLALWDSFKANGVEFPFPHREIIMRTPVDVRPTVND
ncbi:MAG: mechanosensitive ion channel domain-containing protein [Pseudomonadota bacterium]